jgi:threonine/homoserine/homoserine lactone efflux protein
MTSELLPWSHIALFAMAFGLAAALPGPAQGALLARGVARGPRAAAALATGLVAGNAVWLGASLAGVGALARHYAPAFASVRWAGAAYLVWLAIRLWRDPPPHAPQPGRPLASGALGGLLLALGNPKAVPFFGAILPAVIDPAQLTFRQAAEVLAVGLFIDGTVQLVYLHLAHRAAQMMRGPVAARVLRRTTAGVSAACAVVVATRSL